MELHYSLSGTGNPLLILHGLLGMSDNWAGFSKTFSKQYQVLVPDLRNHGRSGHSPVFSYLAMCDDIDELLFNEHIQHTFLLGHSMGGKIAMQYALDNPQKVDKLIVVDISPVQYPYQSHPLVELMMNTNLSGFSERKEIETHLLKEINDTRIVGFLMKNLSRSQGNNFIWKPGLPAINDNIREVFREIKSETVFSKPVLFIRGGNSDYILPHHEPHIYKLFPNAVIKTIDKASHWVHADQSEEFAKLVLEFLSLK